MYMVGSLQVQAYKSTGDMVYLDRAAQFLQVYVDTLQRSNGLFHHREDAPFCWGRGNVWAVAALTEVHDEAELDIALEANAAIIGINNRDLSTFAVGTDTCYRLKARIPETTPVIAESGFRSPAEVVTRSVGVLQRYPTGILRNKRFVSGPIPPSTP